MNDEFRESVRAVLKRSVRAGSVWENEPADTATFQRAAALGWLGLLVDEKFGGAGAGMSDAVVVAEELGARLSAMPFLSTVLASTALSSGSAEQQERWLPGLASGESRGAVLLTGGTGRLGPVDVAVTDGALRGECGFGLDVVGADILVVDAGELYAVPASLPGIEITELLGVDRTRRLSTVVFHDVPVDRSMVLPDARRTVLDRAAVLLAADALGAARRALTMSVEYAKQREQFGRPIGSFQAIKHKLADMYVLVRGAAAAVAGAAGALDEGGDTARSVGVARSVAVASAYVRDAAAKVTGDAIQVHGGIGYTWEHDCHRLFKRAKLDETYLGDPSVYRERLAHLLLDG